MHSRGLSCHNRNAMETDRSLTLSRDEIIANAERIRPYVRETPLVLTRGADFGIETETIVFKLELLQHAGSFKSRGAFTNLLTRDVPPAGVAAASGGNHGAAVAFAAQRLGHPAHIFVPTVSTPAKLEQIRSYGADLIIGGDRYADALRACEAWLARSGALSIHAFDQPETLLGQASLGLELERQAADVDTVLVSVGGGGLIGGIASWYRSRTTVIGVEPEEAPTLYRALEAGQPVDAPAGGIAADSLAPARVGSLMFPIARRHVQSVVLVTDDEIRAAQQAIWTHLRIVTEPGAATAFAALLTGRYRPQPGEKVAVILCGGNTSAVDFGPPSHT